MRIRIAKEMILREINEMREERVSICLGGSMDSLR
jgi:hypothetical protein